ncbi:hypothetical protein M9H77_08346 [Catharanthus roseus]|uniref:Uncharacterized protein n=1 Tax=Catharanthus roseus TaxID=4058 RepID=A0ACC0BXV2_CATRO|nr:hypothetical protein M9H77_08346 [Catharanthus roseus]
MKTSFRPGLKCGENEVNRRVSGLHCTWLVPCTRSSFGDVDGFLTLRVHPLEEGHSTLRAWANRYLRGHRVMLCRGTPDVFTYYMGMRLFVNRALVWCLAGVDYEMPELGSGDMVIGSRLCLWSPTIALHVCLSLGVEAALICLDSLRLPSCARNPPVGSRISFVKIIRENVFL